jgi:antitoxin (DNA-binding transcriptional repressor) of toxin-antitoxin stability system
MKTATVSHLRNEFGRLSKWLEAGEVVQILKRGRPFARVVPEARHKTFVGACRSSKPLPRDIDEPVDVGWDADE